LSKGDAFVAAQLAGIMAAKQTAALIPLAHPLPLASVDVAFEWTADGALRIESQARTAARAAAVYGAIALAAFICWVVLRISDRLIVRIGRTGIQIMTRMMGLLLAALAVQFVITGVQDAMGK